MGFEPMTERGPSVAVFKTAALGHYASPPARGEPARTSALAPRPRSAADLPPKPGLGANAAHSPTRGYSVRPPVCPAGPPACPRHAPPNAHEPGVPVT